MKSDKSFVRLRNKREDSNHIRNEINNIKLMPQAQVGCMRQVLRPGALGRPRGIRWRGRWEGGSGWGTHVNPWLIHINV